MHESVLKKLLLKRASRVSIVVRAFTSQRCGRIRLPDPASYVKFVVCSLLCSERFSSGWSGFPSKTNMSKSNSILECTSIQFLNEFLWTPWCSMGKQIAYIFLEKITNFPRFSSKICLYSVVIRLAYFRSVISQSFCFCGFLTAQVKHRTSHERN